MTTACRDRATSPPTVAGPSAALLALMATAAGVAVASITVAQSLLGDIAATFGVGTGAAGVVVSATQLGYACGLVLVVPLGDIVEPRRLVAGQAFLSAGALAVAAAAPSFAVLLGAMAVVGALAVVIQVLVALAVALAPAGERGRAIGIVTGGVVAGLVAARTVAGLVNDALGWRAVFAIAAVLTVTLAAVLRRRLPPTAVASSQSYGRLVSGLPGLYRRHRVLRQRAVLALAIFATFNVLWTPLALELAGRPHRLSPTGIGLFGLVGIAGALAARRAGRLADRGHGRLASGTALALMLAGWLPIALAGWSLPALVAGMVLVDVAVQTVHVVSQSQVTAVDPRARSSLVAAYMVCLHGRQRRGCGGVDGGPRRPRVGGSRDPRRGDQRVGPGLLGGHGCRNGDMIVAGWTTGRRFGSFLDDGATACPRPVPRSAATSTSTIAAARIRALTAPRPIKPTSTRCQSAWQPNPGGRLHLSTRKICSDNRDQLFW